MAMAFWSGSDVVDGKAYQPSARRPIAEGFRHTADVAVRFCVRWGMHPDAISYASIVAATAGAACLLGAARFPWLLLVAPLPLYLRLWLNMLDGMVAVASGKASRRGEILNELPDRISDVLVFAAIALSGLAQPSLGYFASIAALLTAYVGMLGQAVGARREFGGVMAKPARMVMVHVGAWVTWFLMTMHRSTAVGGLSAMDWTCALVIAGCVQTIVVRLASAMRILRTQADPTPTASHVEPDEAASTPGTFRGPDGAEIFYRAWLPKTPTSKALILLHRGHEHSGRWAETVRDLNLSDTAVFAWDQRGHGQSAGDRGAAENVAQLAKDLDSFAKHLCEAHGIDLKDTIVMAHSVGAVVAATWVHDYAPPLRGLVLATPALRVKLYVPLAIPLLRLKRWLLGGGQVKSYVKSRVLTHDPRQQAAYDADRTIFRQISVPLLLDLHDTSTRLIDDAGAITTPTLMLAAGSDWVVRRSSQWSFFARLSSPIKQFELLPGFYHAIFHERDRAIVVDRVRRFIDECFSRPSAPSVLVDADQGGFTRTEYDRLRLGDGSLKWPIGRLIDRNYLNSPGWRGIRQRKVNLESLLRRAMAETAAAGREVRILDIASGPGRYVLETLASSDLAASAVLRDYKPANVAAARELAKSLGLEDRATISQDDAFDRASLAAVSPRPTIGIVSGLYELFPENETVRRSLAGLADAIEPGGFLIYTCQPWHPQLEFIAKALGNREGKPWVMRRRTQGEMDALVAAAGFEKVDQLIDPWGIFTVCLAKRSAR